MPGVGGYTAAAIGSIAFGLPAAVVDGNVRRVIARLFALRSRDELALVRLSHDIAQALLPVRTPGRFNEAMMELGALVCTPGQPRCQHCPVRTACEAHQLGLQDKIPVAAARAASPLVRWLALVITRQGEILMGRREPDGLFGGLWDPPTFDDRRAARAWLALFTSVHRLPPVIATVRHVLTHRVLQVDVIGMELNADTRPRGVAVPNGYDALRWMTPIDRKRSGTSSLTRRILRSVGERNNAPHPPGTDKRSS